MVQLASGIRAVLSKAWAYDFFQEIAGARKFRRKYVTEFFCPTGTERILDIGCGTAMILDFLPETITYVGFDASSHYIEAAQSRFGERGSFYCQYVDEMTIKEIGAFDVVMANGLIHHLDDGEVNKLACLGAAALKPGGRMITHDPCYHAGQSRLARYFISKDRGQNVRTDEEYAALLRPHFSEVQCYVRYDMANIPYSHAITVSRK